MRISADLDEVDTKRRVEIKMPAGAGRKELSGLSADHPTGIDIMNMRRFALSILIAHNGLIISATITKRNKNY